MFARLKCELDEFKYTIQTPKARAAALATADQDIDAAKHLVLSMLTLRNTLVPISTLPAEILARIFHLFAFSKQHYSLDLVHVTHVYRRWRQIALDDSTLWTHFSDLSKNKEWIAERLSRARNAPLVVELNGSMGKDAFSLFSPHISHTRELYLHNLFFRVSEIDPEIVRKIGIQKAPVLERFELSVSSISPIDIKHLSGHSFFKGPFPNLRIFCVSQILFPWSLVPRGQLTQLAVTLEKEVLPSVPEVSSHDNWNELIDLLVNCPALEVLTLKKCLPTTLSESSGGQTIHLPRLLWLCLDGSGSRVMNLLKMLKLSSSTMLRLTYRSENTATQEDHLILPILSAHFNDPTPVKFRTLTINLDHVGYVGMAASSLPISPITHTHVIQTDSDAELCLSFHRVFELNDRVDILRRSCNLLFLSNIEFLSISCDILDSSINWSKVFQHCTEVTTVKVYGCGTIGFLQALTASNRADTTACGKGGKKKRSNNGRDAQAQAIFPKLTSLLLEMLDFTDVVPGSGVLYDLVMSAVKRRKAIQTPLTALCIDSCVISERQAKELEKLVPDFRWDHFDGYYGYNLRWRLRVQTRR